MSLPAFGQTGADKDRKSIRMLGLYLHASQNHRTRRRRKMLCHAHRSRRAHPRRTAGRCKNGGSGLTRMLADLHCAARQPHKLLRLLFGHPVRRRGHLHDLAEPEMFQRRHELPRRERELHHRGGRHKRDHLFPGADGREHPHNLRLLHRRTERTGNKTLSTENALRFVDARDAVLTLLDRADRTDLFAGNRHLDNGMKCAGLFAQTATYTQIRIDMRLVVAHADGSLRAIDLAGTSETALTGIRHHIPRLRTGIAGLGHQ